MIWSHPLKRCLKAGAMALVAALLAANARVVHAFLNAADLRRTSQRSNFTDLSIFSSPEQKRCQSQHIQAQTAWLRDGVDDQGRTAGTEPFSWESKR